MLRLQKILDLEDMAGSIKDNFKYLKLHKVLMEKIGGLYLRVSTDEQKKEGLSILAQENKLKQLCNLKEIQIYKIYIDAGVSGSVPIIKRPEGSKFMSDAKTGEFNIGIVVKLDRAFRNTKDALDTLDFFGKNNIDFISASEDIDTTTAMGRFFFTLLSALAELERGMTIDRNRAIMIDKFNRGITPARVPFGYKAIYKNKKEHKNVIGIDIHPVDSKVVIGCFLMSSNGASYKEVCSKFKIKPQQYYNILKNKFYCGIITFDGEEKKGIHKPIISEEMFEDAL